MSNKSNTGQLPQQLNSKLTQPKTDAATGDLERLRDILFGQHARTTEERLSALEAEVERSRHELIGALNSLGDSSASQLTTARRELTQRLDEQAASQTQTLHLGLDAQRNELSTQLNTLERRIEQLSSDLFAQIRVIRQELTERLDHASADARQRDDTLRQEILALTKSLDDGKVSRLDLGQALIELGQKIQGQD